MSFGELWWQGYLFTLFYDTDGGGFPVWQIGLGIGGGILLFGILIPYLLGSINSAVVFSRLLYHDDIRNRGSGNAGTTNMLRTYGKGAAGLTLLGDVLKTAVAVMIASLMTAAPMGGWVAAFFCMVGHIFPIYYHFKGGKGVLCAATAVAMLSPFAFGCAFLTFLIMVSMSRYVSLGSIVSALMLPLYVNTENLLFERGGLNGLMAVFMALLIVWCHRANIKRIQNRTESKLSFKKKDK